MGFTTLDLVKSALSIRATSTKHDLFLNAVIASIDKEFLAIFCLDQVGLKSYVEVHDILDQGERFLRTERYPLTAVTQLRTIDANGDTGQVILATDFDFDEFGLIRLCGPIGAYFPQGRCTTEATITAGFDPIDPQLQLAATMQAMATFNRAPKSGFKSERIGKYAYTLADASSMSRPADVQRILNGFERPFG